MGRKGSEMINVSQTLYKYLQPGDEVIEAGVNKCGEYLKCLNGNVYMLCYNDGIPIQLATAPEPLDEVHYSRGQWK